MKNEKNEWSVQQQQKEVECLARAARPVLAAYLYKQMPDNTKIL
jgi:hypothetical protein